MDEKANREERFSKTLFGSNKLEKEHSVRILTVCMMFLVVLTSVAFAQSNPEPKMATEPIHLAQVSERQAPTSARPPTECINPSTGQPDQLVQCLVDPCQGFVPGSPFETCTANYCGGCHAILCGVVLSDVSSIAIE
jgi:hypothetical protein